MKAFYDGQMTLKMSMKYDKIFVLNVTKINLLVENGYHYVERDKI